MEVESLDEPRGCSLGLRPPACQTGPVGPAPPGRARHARAPVLGEDPRGRPHVPSRSPFVPGGSADTRNDVLKVFPRNSTAVSPAFKSWEAGAAEGGAVGSQRPSPSAWGIPAPRGDPPALQPRHPCSGVSCSPSSLFNDKSGQEKRAFPHVWTRAGAGPGRGLAAGAFAARGGGRVSLLAPSAFLTKTRGTVVAFVTCGSW